MIVKVDKPSSPLSSPIKRGVFKIMKKRCGWVPENDKLYLRYHDKEWGVPVRNDRKFFEMLLLEGFQAGLSWSTILKKRKNFRNAFSGFNFIEMAKR